MRRHFRSIRAPVWPTSLLVATLVAATCNALADHDEARALHEAGEIQSLEKIIDRATHMHPGRVIEAELHEEASRLLYEIELVGDDGIVRELYFDARTGEPVTERIDDD